MAKSKLSSRAEKLLKRVRAGEFYMPYDPALPKAMDELVAAGLVVATGRVTRIQLCYVPAPGYGYKPFKPEKFPNDRECFGKQAMSKQPHTNGRHWDRNGDLER